MQLNCSLSVLGTRGIETTSRPQRGADPSLIPTDGGEQCACHQGVSRILRQGAAHPPSPVRSPAAASTLRMAVTTSRYNAPATDGRATTTRSRPSGISLPSSRRASRSSRLARLRATDRKSTRLNSSHVKISYAVFCLKKKKKKKLKKKIKKKKNKKKKKKKKKNKR